MRKAILVLAFFMFSAHILFARTPLKDERRLEEEARQSLRDTEIQLPAQEEPAGESTLSPEFAYFKGLLAKKYLLCSDAIRPLLILLGESGPIAQAAQPEQVSLLKERKIIPVNSLEAFASDEPLRKGLAAYMFCRALGIKGGLGLRLFSSSQRYALRELVFEGIMSEGGVDDIMSGQEFILTFTNAAQYLAEKNQLQRKNIK